MDKKIGIIVGILIVLVIGLIVGAFIADSKDDSILIINDVGYSKDSFEKYYKVRYYEELKNNEQDSSSSDETSSEAEETSNTVNKEELKTTALNEFATYMIINKEAKQKGFKLSDEAVKEIQEEYDADDFDRDTLTSLGVTRDDYVEAKKVEKTYNGFVETIDEYYDVPQSTIDLYFENNKDSLKGIDFRVMYFNVTSTEATTDENGEEIPASSNKEEIIQKAQAILDRVKAGEDFEELAKENADARYAYTNTELKQVNGELESCDIPYLQSYFMFSCSDIETPLKALENVGDYTELVTTDNYVAFARLEAVRDDVTEDTRNAMIKSLAQTVGESYLSSLVQSSQVIKNEKLLKLIEI